MTFISTVFENVYMVKLVLVPRSSWAFDRVGYGGATYLVVSEPRFRLLYKMIFEIVSDMHCIAYKG